MKIGDKIVCIDNINVDYIFDDISIIEGNIYIIKNIIGSQVCIEDNGEYFFKSRFISLKEFRKLKLTYYKT